MPTQSLPFVFTENVQTVFGPYRLHYKTTFQ